jgi:transcriptional regulator with XRE-family HTH domain
MLRTPASYSLTIAAAVRGHFALTQAELARWLGVSEATVKSVENGRRQLSPAGQARLGRLSALLPPGGPPLPEPATLPPPPPRASQQVRASREARVLALRARRCRHLASQLAFELETWQLQDAALLRRRQGLAALRTALTGPAPYHDPLADPAAEAAWLARIEADTAATPPRPSELARAHHTLRRRLLLEEADELTRLLNA